MKLREWKNSNGDKIDLSTSSKAASTTNSSASASTTTSTTSYKDKFEKLLDYHIAHPSSIRKVVSQEIRQLFENEHMARFVFEEVLDGMKQINIRLVASYFKKSMHWRITVYVDDLCVESTESVGHNKGFNNLITNLGLLSSWLKLNLPPKDSKEYQELLESVSSSTAEDFQLYENLWD